MRRLECGAISLGLMLVIVVSGCGGDKKSPATSNGGSAGAPSDQAGGGAGGAASGSGGKSAGNGGASGSAGSAPVGGSAGAGGASCQVLGAGESGPHGLTRVYTTENEGTATFPAGLENDQAYFEASGMLFAAPAAGGAPKALGAFSGSHELVRGGKVYAVTQLSAEPTRKLFSSPLTDLTTLTTLADGIEDPYRLVADDTALYYDRRENSSIFQVPIGGGSPVELVPGAEPQGMVSVGGYLYWIDSKTQKLERVPVAGGPREPLLDVAYGGPMAATDTAVYWIDLGSSIEKWEMGDTKSQTLSKKVGVFGANQALAVSGNTLFWAYGFGCGYVYSVQTDGTGEALFSQGVYNPTWIGVTDKAVFVLGDDGMYRADR